MRDGGRGNRKEKAEGASSRWMQHTHRAGSFLVLAAAACIWMQLLLKRSRWFCAMFASRCAYGHRGTRPIYFNPCNVHGAVYAHVQKSLRAPRTSMPSGAQFTWWWLPPSRPDPVHTAADKQHSAMWKKKACVSVRVLMFARTCERVFRLYHKKDEGGAQHSSRSKVLRRYGRGKLRGVSGYGTGSDCSPARALCQWVQSPVKGMSG